MFLIMIVRQTCQIESHLFDTEEEKLRFVLKKVYLTRWFGTLHNFGNWLPIHFHPLGLICVPALMLVS